MKKFPLHAPPILPKREQCTPRRADFHITSKRLPKINKNEINTIVGVSKSYHAKAGSKKKRLDTSAVDIVEIASLNLVSGLTKSHLLNFE